MWSVNLEMRIDDGNKTMRWILFPFSLLNRLRPSGLPAEPEPPYSATEEYVSRLMNMPIQKVAKIYRAGRPWPVGLDDFDRLVQQEAKSVNCSLEQARLIMLKRLQWQKSNAESGGKPMDEAAFQTWQRYRNQVARRLKEEAVTVGKVYSGVLKYRWQEGKQPD